MAALLAYRRSECDPAIPSDACRTGLVPSAVQMPREPVPHPPHRAASATLDDESTDHDPLYRFHHWQANLRVLGITEIKTVPYVPISHPFVERLIGSIVVSIWTVLCFGQPSTWNRSYRSSTTITIDTALTPVSPPKHRKKLLRQCVPNVEVISMERTLSRIISDEHGGIITNSPCTPTSSGSLL